MRGALKKKKKKKKSTCLQMHDMGVNKSENTLQGLGSGSLSNTSCRMKVRQMSVSEVHNLPRLKHSTESDVL